MGKCEFSESCKLLAVNAIANNSGAMIRLQKNFCNEHKDLCARHLIHAAIGEESVPELMLPNQREWAKQILAEHQVCTNP